tara:strand:+ start:184 stop:444 length:261 start_codon:yes stop_codon:yes gene_type:complete
MGGILSKPKIPGPSPEQIAAEKEALQAQREERALLAEQRATEEERKLQEMQQLQQRKRRVRYGGQRMLLAERETPETGVKKTTLGG